MAIVEVVAFDDAGALKLREDAIHRRQANRFVLRDEALEDIFRTQVALLRPLQNLKHLEAGQRHLEASLL